MKFSENSVLKLKTVSVSFGFGFLVGVIVEAAYLV